MMKHNRATEHTNDCSSKQQGQYSRGTVGAGSVKCTLNDRINGYLPPLIGVRLSRYGPVTAVQ